MVVLSVGARDGGRVASRRAFRGRAHTRGIRLRYRARRKRSRETQAMAGASRHGSRVARGIAARVRRETGEELARLDVENVRTLNGTREVSRRRGRGRSASTTAVSLFFATCCSRGRGVTAEWGNRGGLGQPPRAHRVRIASKHRGEDERARLGGFGRSRRARARRPGRSFPCRSFRAPFPETRGNTGRWRAGDARDRLSRSRRGRKFSGRTARDDCARRALVCDSTVTRAASTFDAKCPAGSDGARHALRFSFATRTPRNVSSDPSAPSRGKFPPHLYGQTVWAKAGRFFFVFPFWDFPLLYRLPRIQTMPRSDRKSFLGGKS